MMNVHAPSALAGLLLAVLSGPAAGQATIEAFAPGPAGIRVQPLGLDDAQRPEVGMELQPGDLISAGAGQSMVELSCAEGAIRYDLVAPFRVLVDVPTDSTCHIHLLGGHAEVVAEVPTETTVGGIPLGSAGTQYSVDVRRTPDGPEVRCMVFDGTLEVLRYGTSLEPIVAGQNLTWAADAAGATRQAISSADIARAAAIYARFDVAFARRQLPGPGGPASTLHDLSRLHADVLASPTDTARRAALARMQLDLQMEDRAGYNLRRVDVTTDARLRTYDIDPEAVSPEQRIRRGLVGGARTPPEVELDPSRRAVTMDAARRRGVVAEPGPTTDGDLALIDAGRLEPAIANIEARVERNAATSRDYFALARAHAARDEPTQVRAYAGRALVLHASDEELSAEELRDLGELLERAG